MILGASAYPWPYYCKMAARLGVSTRHGRLRYVGSAQKLSNHNGEMIKYLGPVQLSILAAGGVW